MMLFGFDIVDSFFYSRLVLYAVIESEYIYFDIQFSDLDSGNPDLEVLMIFQISYFIYLLLNDLFKRDHKMTRY